MTKFNSLNAKAITSSTWVKHYETILTQAATSVNVTGLNGDVDGDHRIIIRAVGGAAGTFFFARPNSSSTSSGMQFISGYSSTVESSRDAGRTDITLGNAGSGAINFSDTAIKVKTGMPRPATTVWADTIASTTVARIAVAEQALNDTTTNIDSWLIYASQTNGLAIGTYILVLKKVESTTTASMFNSVEVPIGKFTGDTFCTIAEGTLGAGATTITLSGLDGDTDIIYELEMDFALDSSNVYLNMRPNNDSGSYYGRQDLYSNGSSVSAIQGTGESYLWIGGPSPDNGYSCASRVLMYVKQGFVRTFLVERMQAKGATVGRPYISGEVYSVTNTNITSLTILNGDGSNIRAGSWYRLKTLKRKV